MPTPFHIPKQSDRELVAALGRIRKFLPEIPGMIVLATVPHGETQKLMTDPPEKDAGIQYVLEANSLIISFFTLRGPGGHDFLQIHRTPGAVWDEVTVPDVGFGSLNQASRSQVYTKLFSTARRELKASDLEAALESSDQTSWDRYRTAQMEVLSSLQQTSEALITEAAKDAAAAEQLRSERFAELESKLRAELEEERKNLIAEFDEKTGALAEREKEIANREANFNTKEARYVARQKQEEQIKQIQDWLDEWNLTEGTTKKRWPITGAYVAALIFTGALTWYAASNNYAIMKSAEDVAKLQWWHWVLMTAKAFFPLAAFTTFMIYFIRWASAWARQHSEEEFQNRALLIDIGRASWLLEAVRDAQERNKEIPPDLLKEMSRNLFALGLRQDADAQPETAADILLQGLTSLRVKSPIGAEIEATRGK